MRHLIDFRSLVRGVVALALLAAASAGVRPAAASCPRPQGTWNTQFLPIPLYLDPNLADVVCGASDCTHFDQIRRTTEAVAHQFFEAAGTRLRFVPNVDETVSTGTVIAGAIHVFGKRQCASGPVEVTWGDLTQDGRPDWGRIAFCDNYGTSSVSWRSYPASSSPSGVLSYQGYLTSALLQVLGFRPTPSCGSDEKSALNMNVFNSHEAHHLYRDDIDALQASFHLRPQVVRGFDVADGTPLPALTGGLVANTLGRLSGCNGFPPGHAYASGPRRSNPRHVRVYGHDGGMPSLVLDLGSLVPGAVTHSPTGTACEGAPGRALVAWLGGYEASTGRQDVHALVTTDGFATHASSLEAWGADRTRAPGVSAAFDPASGRYVLAWRNDTGEIVTTVQGDGAPLRRYRKHTLWPTYWRSSDVPSLACAPASSDPDNCILAWLDTSWTRPVLWTKARVDPTGPALVLSDTFGVQVGADFASGSPALAFEIRPGSPDGGRWYLAFQRGDWESYACSRSSTDATWSDCDTLPADDPATGAPTLTSHFDCDDGLLCGTVWNPAVPRVVATRIGTGP